MRFSIVTPSLRQPDFLRLCVRSVADQGVEYEHLIQDGGSGPDLEQWARGQAGIHFVSERDDGIYDALNRGFARAGGEICAWLNCDEQYLPGALEAVAARFREEPDLDVLLADNLILDARGGYIAHRFSLLQRPWECSVRFAVSSCALFFRRRVWSPFDTRWRSAGDWWWYTAMLRRGARAGILRRFVATFAETGENLGLGETTAAEQAVIHRSRPWWVRGLLPLWLLRHRLRMKASGAYRVAPFTYCIHEHGADARVEHRAARPTARWRRAP